MKTTLNFLNKRSAKYIWRLSLSLILILSTVYIATGKVVNMEPFFIFPVVVASWYGSNKAGVSLALLSTLILILIQIAVFQNDFSVRILFFYGLPYAIAYTVIAFLITNFRKVHRVEETAADTDFLTGALNSRSFYIELANELVRSHRYNHVFSLAYMDIDDFKNINDTKGHEIGDQLLIEVARCLISSLRKSDKVARLGGDEYACLLPETDENDAKQAFSKVRNILQQSMNKKNWPVSFSIGLVTFKTIPGDIKQAMKVADDLMYSVKNNKKNSVAHQVWHGKVKQNKGIIT